MYEQISVGLVIPSYNEGLDLIDTLKTALAQSSPFKEIIVVDDSSDGTEQLVSLTFGEKVRLIHREQQLGRCSARNLGMQTSTAEVIVILNADVRLPFNFCENLQQRYSFKDCDALGVEVVITNTHHSYARYLYAQHLTLKKQDIGWTEGFSVRRSAFFKTKGFPDGYPLQILAGEDVEFVSDLQRTGAKLYFDFDLKVTTVMPEDWATIESQIRGRASLRTFHFIYDNSLLELFLRSIVKQIRRLVMLVTVIPFCYRVIWLWKHFNCGWKDLFYYAKYELSVNWLQSHQEWLDLRTFTKLHRQNAWSIVNVLIKQPSQLVTFQPVKE